ncbi:hypothetical protein [Bradyrhizobium sp. DASA03007]|uniref:hypothetical protein n=1 Tax=unclassified Bradyrhizobium TaxID=2631580 RepID=UPI003F6E70E5
MTSWIFKAEGLLTCLILDLVRFEPHLRTMVQLRTLSSDRRRTSGSCLRTIASAGAPAAENWLAVSSRCEVARNIAACCPARRPPAAGPGNPGEISTASTFQLPELVSEVSTIYLIVDEKKLTVYAGFLRVLVGCVINALTRVKAATEPQVQGTPAARRGGCLGKP